MRHFHQFGPHHGGWVWVLSGITLILLCLVLIAVLITLVRFWSHRPGSHHYGPPKPTGWQPPAQPPGAPQDPAKLLADRLARGEIDPEDYRQRLAALQEPPPGR
ncbi:SHOCT domain-containing protein [Kitasatospora sp. NPDC002227]|uniref:SHOCT domain-containing protein n=1 Tax=Kitasatospora sp. NPDC002227 TaxID=3154773 RepID=UPI00332E5D24